MDNKARITYRLDPNRVREEGDRRPGLDDTGKVIPLYQEEYRVLEDRKEGRPEERGDRWQRESVRGGQRQERQEPLEARRNDPIRDYQGLNQFTTDYGAWSSPYDAETKRIEELIRESNERQGRRPAAPEPEPGNRRDRYLQEYEERETERDREHRYNAQTGYYHPEPGYPEERDDRWDGPIVMGPRYVRHTRPPWLKISASIAGAAVTGVLLGFFALSLFNGPDDAEKAVNPTASADKPAVEQEVKSVAAGAQGDSKSSAGGTAASGKAIAFAYAGKTYSVLQNGTFSAQQGAEQAKSDLVKKGLAAATEQTDKYYVYAGVSTDKESAKVMSQHLKDANNLDIYVKDYAVPAVTGIRWNGSADTLKSYLDQSDKLLQSINKLTVLNLDGQKPSPLDASTLQSIATAHTAWAQLSTAVAQEAGDDNRPLVQRMNNAMNSAKTSLDEYKKNPSAAMLWQSQTYMMQFIIAEKELLSRIGM